MADVVIYSSAAGMTSVQKYTESMNNLMNAKQANPRVVYLDVEPEDKEMVWSKSGKKGVYPLLFVDGEFVGDWPMIEEMNEEERLDEALKK